MINEQRALKHFVEIADGFHRSSLALAASAAVCFIVNGAKDEADAVAVAEALEKAITETGLGRSSVFRYISLGRKLAARLLKDFPRAEDHTFSGPLSDVLDAKSPQAASTVVALYLGKVGVENADQLDVYLGAPPRSQRGAAAQQGAGAAARSTPRHASPDSVVATVTGAEPADALTMMQDIIKLIRDVDLLAGWRSLIDAQIAKLSKPRASRKSDGTVRHAGRRATASGIEIHG